VKLKHVLFTVLVVLLLDQVLKVYIKTNFAYGQEVNVLGDWFKLNFIENEGMAFGMSFGGEYGKLFLTLFRLIACVLGVFFIQKYVIQAGYKNGLIFCSALILAGALGNCVDSVFYGKIFTANSFHGVKPAQLVPWGQGYGDLFHGKVVDMLYFPILRGTYPSWVPGLGGNSFIFFRPVFNIADAAISTGVIAIFVFQNSLLKKKNGYNSDTPSNIDNHSFEPHANAPVSDSHPTETDSIVA
jgi:signal peptidase II